MLCSFPTFHRLSLNERLPITVHLHVHRRAKTNTEVAYLQYSAQRTSSYLWVNGNCSILACRLSIDCDPPRSLHRNHG